MNGMSSFFFIVVKVKKYNIDYRADIIHDEIQEEFFVKNKVECNKINCEKRRSIKVLY